MTRIFTRNMFIMLLSIMIGAIIITYFVADIQGRMKIETITTEHIAELTNLQSQNEKFTAYFLYSLGLIDQAREDRAFGNHHFDLALIWYRSALTSDNNETLKLYKNWATENCTNAMPNYINSHNNFIESGKKFIETKTYTTHEKHSEIIDLYINLTASGTRLTMLRYNASMYLKQLTTNITFVIQNNTPSVMYMFDVTELMGLFNSTMSMYLLELELFEEIQEEIDEYPFFDEIR